MRAALATAYIYVRLDSGVKQMLHYRRIVN